MNTTPEQLDRIEAKLDRLLATSEPLLISTQEAMRFLGCRNKRTFYRTCLKLGVKSTCWGRFRRVDLENAAARLALSSQ